MVMKQYRKRQFQMYHRAMAELPIHLDRAGRKPLAAQIYGAIREAIETGGSARARGCRPGGIWRLSSASPAAPCASPTSV